MGRSVAMLRIENHVWMNLFLALPLAKLIKSIIFSRHSGASEIAAGPRHHLNCYPTIVNGFRKKKGVAPSLAF